jgi:aspartate/methionine/tyrosine aminotransferase
MRAPTPSRQAQALRGEAAYSVLAQATELERAGRAIIHLEIGQPDFKTPQAIIEEGCRALQAGETRYAPPLGIRELRESVARYLSATRHVSVSFATVVITPSAKTAIFLALSAIVDPGDEVIYPNPGFPTYENVIEYLGGVPKGVPLLEANGFSFDIAALRSLMSEKTKAIVLNSPSNPTGGIIPKEDLAMIAELAKGAGAWVITDEIYSRLIYDTENAPSIYSLPGMQERTILIDGFSKTYAMPGWRLGYLAVPPELVPILDNLVVNSVACTATFVQYAGIEALENPDVQEEVETMRKEYQRRRDFIVERLNAIPGFSCTMPRGAFYAFPNISALGRPSADVARSLLASADVAVLPGTAFGEHGEGYLRFSYATSLELITRALDRVEEAIRKIC